MALLRSDVLNKELIEKVIKQKEGTSRVCLESITVSLNGDSHLNSSLIKESLRIHCTVKVKNGEKEYFWLSKLINSDINANIKFNESFKRETEFFNSIVPEIHRLTQPSFLKLDTFIWAQHDELGKEVLLFEEDDDFVSRTIIDEELDLSHIIHAVEWLAKFHGLSYVLKTNDDGQWNQRFKALNKGTLDESVEFQGGMKTKLMRMLMKSLQEEIAKDKVVANPLMSRHDWLENLKSTIEAKRAKRNPNAFQSLIHGEPWFGNVKFSYRTDSNGKTHVNEALFQDFHKVSLGNPGDDLAMLIMTSTDRKFREKYLDIVLGHYLTELKDVIGSQGIDPKNIYDFEELKEDYKCGLMMGLSFSLFCVPILLKGPNDTTDEDEMEEEKPDGVEQIKSLKLSNNVLDALNDVLEFLK